ncbi:complex I intermediate-associated protein 30-domain-containing protein [Clohesyomyces aquaticus]|uniref:Complex I intermediate-associated protein 30-domain-containing protein n=1 Tax=Clohesyomyces aquaticus TaxID=1231657 RepID=A0A1Y1ZNE7_9PLEO|nr:complex I intermediate-associated protein 30-domain-containing protein [Clohesyomyces aquaticus]
MQPTARCLAPGFLKRSLDEFKRLSLFALKFEGLKTPTKPLPLITFDSPDSLSRCKPITALNNHLRKAPPPLYSPAHAVFRGTISTQLPRDAPHIQRTGYAAWRTLDRGSTIFGKTLWDLDLYTYLALHFNSDGRKYFINLQTESIVPTDIHQHRLYSKTPGEWETVLIKLSEFVRTNHGQVVEPQREMLTSRVRTVGIGLIDRMQGPYHLKVAEVWATNATRDDNILDRVLSKGAVSGLPMKPSRQGRFGELKREREKDKDGEGVS